MTLTLLTPPAAEPVTAADVIAQTHLRTEADVDADLVDLYLSGARREAETYTRRQFVTATWRIDLPRFCSVMEIPLPPLQEVVAVRYYDEAGDLQTLDASSYLVVNAHSAPVHTPQPMPGKVLLQGSAPSTAIRPDAVQIEFVAGYGEPAAVPAGIKHGILLQTADSYAHRETEVVGVSAGKLSRTVEHVLSPYLVP